jgi:3-oxoadipate enol-lactonase
MMAHGVFSMIEGNAASTRLPVVMVHGLGLDFTMWDSLAAQLSPTRQIVRLDVRGHGRSDGRDYDFNLADLANDVVAVLDAHGIAKADYVGLSMGGMIGQQLAILHPSRVNRIALTCTSSAYAPEALAMWNSRIAAIEQGGMVAVVDMLMQRFFSPAFLTANGPEVQRLRARVLSTNPKGYIGGCHAIKTLNLTSALHRIVAPTLVISGGIDVSLPPAMGQLIAKHIPNAQYVEMEGAAHIASSEFPDLFNGHVQRFFDA